MPLGLAVRPKRKELANKLAKTVERVRILIKIPRVNL